MEHRPYFRDHYLFSSSKIKRAKKRRLFELFLHSIIMQAWGWRATWIKLCKTLNIRSDNQSSQLLAKFLLELSCPRTLDTYFSSVLLINKLSLLDEKSERLQLSRQPRRLELALWRTLMTQRGVMNWSRPDCAGFNPQSDAGKRLGSAEQEKKRNKTEPIRTCCSSSAELNCVKYKPSIISRPPSSSRKTEIFIFTLGEKMKETDESVFN